MIDLALQLAGYTCLAVFGVLAVLAGVDRVVRFLWRMIKP